MLFCLCCYVEANICSYIQYLSKHMSHLSDPDWSVSEQVFTHYSWQVHHLHYPCTISLPSTCESAAGTQKLIASLFMHSLHNCENTMKQTI